jgi:hypothetical protein
VRVADLNWMQLEEYLSQDDRIVLPLGSGSPSITEAKTREVLLNP